MFAEIIRLQHETLEKLHRMSTTQDSIQQETTGLQAKFADLSGKVDTLTALAVSNDGADKQHIADLEAQIAALQAADVDPSLLTPLAALQTSMQAKSDQVAATLATLTPPAPAP